MRTVESQEVSEVGMIDERSGVFVWRHEVIDESILDDDGKDYARYTDSSSSELNKEPCGYCSGPVIHTEEWGEIHESSGNSLTCDLCGWGWTHESTYAYEMTSERLLREFDINSTELSLDEVGSYLRAHYADISSVSGRTFERLIGDVFKNQGYHIEMTKASRDGGYDLLLLNGPTGPEIVEVKRWLKPVGVSLVRQLRGVQVREDIRRAVLVTSGRFTGPARDEAEATRPAQQGYSIELIDADDVLRLLATYKTASFSLAELSAMRLKAWQAINKVTSRL